MRKIKIGHRAKFRDRDNFFSAGFISVSRDFTPYFHFRCVARATLDRNLICSADACFLVMGCVGYSRAQLKTLSSLLNSEATWPVSHVPSKYVDARSTIVIVLRTIDPVLSIPYLQLLVLQQTQWPGKIAKNQFW